jgi:Mg-chelatase subunit ChlD
MKNLKLFALISLYAGQSMASTLTLKTRYEIAESGVKVKGQKDVAIAAINPLSSQKIAFTHVGILKTRFITDLSNQVKSSLKAFEDACLPPTIIEPLPTPIIPGPFRPVLPVVTIPDSTEEEKVLEAACKVTREEVAINFDKALLSLKNETLKTSILFQDEKLLTFVDSLSTLSKNMKEAPTYIGYAHLENFGGGSLGGGMKALAAPGGLNLSAGGAQDIGSFKKMMEEGLVPASSSLPVEGLLSEFDLSENFECAELVCLNTSSMIDLERNKLYVQVHMNSNVTYDTFKRKPLNLGIVLDISGSMSATDNTEKNRLEWAKESIYKMLEELNSDDFVSIVLFDSESEIFLPTTKVEDKEAIAEMVAKIETKGATNLEAGLRDGYELVSANFTEGYENRIVLLTDANLNVGVTADDAIVKMVSDFAGENIGLSAVGIGVNFNQEFIHQISMSKGGNYQFVNSGAELYKMARSFKFMVTPVLYNFKAELVLKDVEAKLVKTYGIPMNEGDKINELMDIRSLFFSEGGGAILLEYDL